MQAEYNSIDTPKGRANLFKKRTDELTKPKAEGGSGLTIDQAIFELRTSANPDDVALLAAMGDEPSRVRTEKLKQEKHSAELTRLADENARAATPGPEVAAAMKKRSAAFNIRIDSLMRDGYSLDQSIQHMRANAADAQLLADMDYPRAEGSRSIAVNAADLQELRAQLPGLSERQISIIDRMIKRHGPMLYRSLLRVSGNAEERQLAGILDAGNV